MASWYVCFDASWNSCIVCSQAPVKLKLKMRKDLSDKEITDISVSSTSLSAEFAAYFYSVKSAGKFAAFATKCSKRYNTRCKVTVVLIIPYGFSPPSQKIAISKTLARKLPLENLL